MAWTSQGEEVRETLSRYVTRLDAQKKAELGHIYDKAVNPFSGEWTNLNGITFVNLRNRENVFDNLGLAMFKEAIGLGPYRYCIIRSYNLDFENLLMLTLLYLPRDKLCIYPEEETLEGPFLHSPWDILGRRICNRPSISIELYLAYLAYKVREVAPM